jgi:DNA-binding transcriptional LysR family regulator
MLDARRLRIFAAVAEEGSFTAAADSLYLSQSAVSQQMAILEREVGLPLMDRGPRGIRLTEAGQLLAERARSLLAEMTRVEHEMHRLAGAPQQVRLGAFPTAGAHLIPLTVQSYRRQHPDSQLVLSAVHAADAAGQLREGSIHVGLVWDYDFAPQPEEPGLHRLPLLDEPLRVILPLGHPAGAQTQLSLESLAQEQWVVRAHRPPHADAFERLCASAGFEPDVVFTADDYQSVQGLVAAGIGISLVPYLSLVAQRPDVVVRPLAHPGCLRRIAALTLPASRPLPAVGQLLAVLREVAEEIRTSRTVSGSAAGRRRSSRD